MPKRKRAASPQKPKAVSPKLIAENDRYFLNPESVSRHLYCDICQEVFTNPQRAPCGHSFCKECIAQWIKNNPSCPSDRKPLKMKDLHHDFLLEGIIGDQKVACPYRKYGCEHIGQLQLLSSHFKSCLYNPVNLPEFLQNSLLEEQEKQKEKGKKSIMDELEEEDSIPEISKPSLKMRLFSSGDEKKKKLLCSMFTDSPGSKS